MSPRRVLVLVIFAVGALCVGGCREQQPGATSPPTKPVERAAEKGSIRLVVRADRTTATVGESIGLSILATAEPDVAVELPPFEATLGPFEVLTPQTPPDLPEGRKRLWSATASLRTLEAGDATIPAITVKFLDRRKSNPNGEAIEGELTTDPIQITITTLQPGEPDAKNMRGIKGEVAIAVPDPARPWRWVIGVLAALLSTVGIMWLVRRARRARPITLAPPLPPHEWAMRELDLLAAAGLVERGELHAYFFRLSEIVRQYIERRFAIMAAEQTTEEFLRAARRSRSLNDEHRSLLAAFLRLADMVKFAKYQPAPADSADAFSAARNFVAQTAVQLQAAATEAAA